jgi:chemotaxis protein CheX
MSLCEIATEGARPVSAEIREKLVDPFIAATRTALGEMAGANVAVRAVFQCAVPRDLGDLSVVLRLTSATEELLAISFPRQTATALVRRVLAGVSVEFDDQLLHDGIGEIGNVIAGQAKALLAGTPYHFVFSLPTVVGRVLNLAPVPNPDRLVVAFDCELGEFALQLFLKP